MLRQLSYTLSHDNASREPLPFIKAGFSFSSHCMLKYIYLVH